jgi:hypothetical protein
VLKVWSPGSCYLEVVDPLVGGGWEGPLVTGLSLKEIVVPQPLSFTFYSLAGDISNFTPPSAPTMMY